MTKEQLQVAIEALGRPRPRFASERRDGFQWAGAPLHAVQSSLREQRAWDEANPAKRAEFDRLHAELDALERREKNTEHSVRLAAHALTVLERSGAGEKSLQAAASPSQTQALEAAQFWMAEQPPRWSLVLRGDVGTGKTVAACWCLRRAALTGESVAFRKSGEVSRLSGFSAGADELRTLKRVGLLVLDDIGAESLNEWGRALLVELLDARYEATARTVLTANPQWESKDPKEPSLVNRLGQRIVDRLRDGGKVVELRGRSMRRSS